MTENNLHILSVNCRSMYTKLLELKLLIYNKKPHIICLSETWAVADRLPNFVNYKSSISGECLSFVLCCHDFDKYQGHF